MLGTLPGRGMMRPSSSPSLLLKGFTDLQHHPSNLPNLAVYRLDLLVDPVLLLQRRFCRRIAASLFSALARAWSGSDMPFH